MAESNTEVKGGSLSPTTWQRQLVDIYSARRQHLGFPPGFKDDNSAIDEYFEDLKLIPVYREYVELKTCYDLLGLQDYDGYECRSLDHVLVSGEAGVGKTRMISRLAYQWAKQKRRPTKRLSFKINKSADKARLLHKFEYVFVIDLRKCEPDMCLVDAIESQLLTNVSKQHLEEFLTNHGSECLYLFHGYNEIGTNDKVLNSNMMSDSHVLVMTRPNKVEMFKKNHTEYVQVISEGFSKTSITRFVETYFSNSKATSDRLLKTIFDNPVTNNLARFPMLLSMMCGIWKNDSDAFPSTISELYHHTMAHLIRRMKAREPRFESMSSGELRNHVSIDQILVNIGKTALDGLLQDSKLIFKEEGFSSQEVLDQAYALGIISKVSVFDKVDYVSFVHKTFQEYCAAAYLSNIADKADHELFKSYLSQMDVGEMEYVLRFCCGTSQKAAEYVLTYIADAYKIETQKEPSADGVSRQMYRLPLLLLLETESKFGVIEQVHLNIRQCFVDIMTMYVDDDPVYRSVLKYFIEMFDNQKAWTDVVQTANVYMNCGYMGGHNGCNTCKCEQHFELLAKMPHLKKLRVTHLCLGEKYRRSVDNFKFECIRGFSNSLDELTLRNYRNFVGDTCEFVDGLSHDVQLHFDCLAAHFFKWSKSDTEKLSNLLRFVYNRGGSIRKLRIERSQWPKEEEEDCNVEQVIENVSPLIPVLEELTLHLIGNRLTKQCVDTLCDGIIQAGQKLTRGVNDVRSQDSMNGQNKEVESDVRSQDSTNGQNEEVENVLRSQDSTNRQNEEVENKTRLRSSGECLPLQDFSLSGNKSVTHSIDKVCDSFRFLSGLNRLDLWCCDLTESNFQTLGPALSDLPNLQDLNLQGNTIGNSLIALNQGINHSKTKRIDLSSTKMSKESKRNVSRLRLPLMEYMYMSHNDMDSCEATAFAEALKHMPKLRELDLPFSSVESDGARALLESFQYTPPRDECRVNLQYNKIASIALEPSQPLSGPTYLNLSYNELNSDGTIALASSFKYMPYLQDLNISENPIGPDGMEALFKNLHYLPKLIRLSKPPFPRDDPPSKLTKLTGKLTAVFQRRRESLPRQTLVQACIEGMKRKGIWGDFFYICGVNDGALLAQHIQEIVRVAATYRS